MKKNISFILLLFICICTKVQAQHDKHIDSLESLLTGHSLIENTARVDILNELAQEFTNTNPDTALAFARQALDIAGKIDYKQGLAVAAYNESDVLARSGKFDEAISLLNKAGTTSTDKKFIAGTYIKAGIFDQMKGDFSASFKNFTTALTLYEKIGNKQGMADAYNGMGVINDEQGNYSAALKNYFASETIDEEIDDKEAIAKQYGNIAIIYFHQADYENALNYYNDALKITATLQDKSFVCGIYNNIAQIYQCQGNDSGALSNYNKGLGLAVAAGDRRNIVSAHLGIGIIDTKKRNYTEALRELFTALNLSKETGDPDYIADVSNNIGMAYLATGKFKEAHQYFDTALSISVETGSVEGIRNSYQELASADSAMGEWKQAYIDNELRSKYNDSIVNDGNKRKIVQEQMQYDFDKQYATETQKLTLQRRYTYLGIAGIMILVVFSFFIFRERGKSERERKKSDELVVQKEGLLQQKDMLMKEIHHRVKNNLQVISTLLDLQLVNITDDHAKDAITESTTRLKAISLIHQQLYQDEQITTIECAQFAKDLHGQISSVFNKPGQTVTFNNNIPITVLDIDTAVPLGLILNELMTNSYKYAFGNGDGSIDVNIDRTSTGYVLTYTDSGPGLPEGMNVKTLKSLGMKLITRLSKQLGGSFNYEKSTNSFIITFLDMEGRKMID